MHTLYSHSIRPQYKMGLLLATSALFFVGLSTLCYTAVQAQPTVDVVKGDSGPVDSRTEPTWGAAEPSEELQYDEALEQPRQTVSEMPAGLESTEEEPQRTTRSRSTVSSFSSRRTSLRSVTPSFMEKMLRPLVVLLLSLGAAGLGATIYQGKFRQKIAQAMADDSAQVRRAGDASGKNAVLKGPRAVAKPFYWLAAHKLLTLLIVLVAAAVAASFSFSLLPLDNLLFSNNTVNATAVPPTSPSPVTDLLGGIGEKVLSNSTSNATVNNSPAKSDTLKGTHNVLNETKAAATPKPAVQQNITGQA